MIDVCKTCREEFEHKCHAHRKYCNECKWVSWNKGTKGIMKAWNKGKPAPWARWDKLFNFKVRELALKRASETNGKRKGELNPNWKDNKVSYGGLHMWVRKYLGKIKECVYCGSEGKIEWASISHKAKRDLNDYIPLCRICHGKYDAEYRNKSKKGGVLICR